MGWTGKTMPKDCRSGSVAALTVFISVSQVVVSITVIIMQLT